MVDEAFLDVAPPGTSLAGDVGGGNIVVLRSFGKFFGLAGLRLGFALAHPATAARLSAAREYGSAVSPTSQPGCGSGFRRASPTGSAWPAPWRDFGRPEEAGAAYGIA